MPHKGFLNIILACLLPLAAYPQYEAAHDYYFESYFRYEDYVYRPNIKTVQLHRPGFELSPAVIRLNAGEQLVCLFDDLDGDVKDYRYTVIHCDANWKPSEMLTDEYLLGYPENPVTGYRFSFNTIQSYTTYRLYLPSENMQLLVSGNYLLKIFIADDPMPVITRRFMMVDPKVSIEAKVKRPTVVEDRTARQEIDFLVRSQGITIEEAYRSLHVVLLQNNRWDNAITDLRPRMIIDNTFDYNYDRENVFDGGNEFRDFDLKSLTYRSPRIKSITYTNDTQRVHLWEDKVRTFQVYHTEEEINGRFFISCEDAQDVNTDCDYMSVRFFLRYPGPLIQGSLYVFGALTDYQFSREALMTYNKEAGGYETTLYLKQGYYNYQYLFLENNSSVGDVTFIEGNHYETNNEYLILVYYRRPGSLYDELIGINLIHSLN